MKIGIITIQKCDNFGADLQAYALGAKLRSLGFDAENIDYLYYKHPSHQKSKREKPIFRLSFFNRVKEFLFPILSKLKGLKQRQLINARRSKFTEWTAKYLKCGPEYRSVDALYENPPHYDVYMVGSDQVWNPRTASNILPYFLDFVPDCARCMSYASSFGVSELSASVFYKYKQLLKKFSAIGLRENSGERIVKSMALDSEVAHVLDPTLLLTAGDWALVSVTPEEVPQGKYLMLYDLIPSPETVTLAKRWAAIHNLRVVRIGDGCYGPGEFVSLFAHAETVVTNSFHGTVFSILHHKPFYSVIPKGMSNAGRIESLVAKLGLKDRMVYASEAQGRELSDVMDWEKVDSKLQDLREQSISFLVRAINGEENKVTHKLPFLCLAAQNKSVSQRAASTSGGIFRLLADYIVSRGGVVFGAAFDSDFHHVRHVAAETIEAVDPLMKSKYVWSDPIQAYKEAVSELKNGREVLFAGTPCQIAAIKNLSKGFNAKLLTVDIVCHGTPRPEMFESYMKELEERLGGKCVSYDFRDKRMGWNFPRVKAEFTGGGYVMILRNDPWYLGFGINATLREGCFSCPYTTIERVADFTIADCWRIASSHPEWDDNKGTSLVLVNSDKAMAVWNEIAAKGTVAFREYDLDLAQMRNMPLMQRARKPAIYDMVKKVFDETGSFAEASKCFMTRKLVFKAWLTFWVKKIGWFYFRRKQ